MNPAEITLEELRELPENGGFDMKEEIRHGKKVHVPYMRPAFVLSEPVTVIDDNGTSWMVGKANGKYYKQPFFNNY